MPHPRLLPALLAGLLPLAAFAHDEPPTELARHMAVAATAFLDALNDEDRATATFPLESPERTQFHYVPMERGGLPFKAMSATQRALALRLLHTGLSNAGSLRAVAIMQLETILRELEHGAAHRDPDLYTVAVFGSPGHLPWGWRFEGHHLSVNLTVTAAGISGTPLFMGANPAVVPAGPKAGLSVLAEEEALGRAFVLSLDADQRRLAIVADRARSEIETAQHSRANPLAPRGLPFPRMTPAQQQALQELVQLYLDRHEDEIAAAARARIEAHGIGELTFAWAGPTDPGEGHYYRVQGPTFVIEYANTQNDANHHHTVFRDFENDFGRDTLGDHFRTQH